MQPTDEAKRESSAEKTVFFLLQATATWLALTPHAKDAFVRERLRPLLAEHAGVRLRYFDAEAYSARASDVLMWQFHDERAYQRLVEALRETPFWGVYFEVREIVPCVEDGFARHYGFEGFG